MYYAFEDDPKLIFVDIHESGEYLFPGTGKRSETGLAAGKGMKLNIPMQPEASDQDFYHAWDQVEIFLRKFSPQFILFQCGVDSMAGDPLTQLNYSAAAHAHATRSLINIASRCCAGKLLALGGGGYNHHNIAEGWTAVVKELVT